MIKKKKKKAPNFEIWLEAPKKFGTALGIFPTKKKIPHTGGAKISKITSFFCYNETHTGGEENRNEKEDEE